MAHLELARIKREDFKNAIEEGIEAARNMNDKVAAELRKVGEDASVIAFGTFWEAAWRGRGTAPEDKVECGCPMTEAGLATRTGGELTSKAQALGLGLNTMNDFTSTFDSAALDLLDNAVRDLAPRGIDWNDLHSRDILRIVD